MGSGGDPVSPAERVVLLAGDRLALAEPLRAAGAEVWSVSGPFASADATRAAFTDVAAAAGRIDVVVYADLPGGAPAAQPLLETADADWDRRAEAPLRAARYVCQAAFRHLHDGGRIVLVTPTAGLVGEAGFVAFATAAEGMRALAKSAARQWGGRGITVNRVAVPLALLGATVPAAVDAPALGRTATVGDVAAVVALLASESGGAITGATIPVDGGIVMR